MIDSEKNSVIPNAAAEHTLPFVSLKGPHVTEQWIRFHLCEHSGDTFLNGFWKAAEIVFGVLG
jgi:hypothetical protein